MSFQNYNVTDNASGQLDAGISPSATTIILKTWEWSSYPASNFIGTVVQYNTPADPTSWVAKREKVLCTVRSTDTLTITRGFGWDTPTSFNADDYFYLNVVADIIDDIQTETTRLENDKANDAEVIHNTWDETWIAWNKTFNDTITANEFVGGWSGITWVTADINWITEENWPLDSNDKIVFYDQTAWGNRKRDARASETVEWLVELATTEEVLNADTWKVINSKDAYIAVVNKNKYLLDNNIVQVELNETSTWTNTIAWWSITETFMTTSVSWLSTWDSAKISVDFDPAWTTTIRPDTLNETVFGLKAVFNGWGTSTSWSQFIWYVPDSTFASNPIWSTITTNHYWFTCNWVWTGFSLYATNANWTTQTRTLIASIGKSEQHSYYARHNWTNIEFYVDWVLEATHTTNLPTLTNIDVFMVEAQVGTWSNASSVQAVYPAYLELK